LPRSRPLILPLLVTACTSPSFQKESADTQAYAILQQTALAVAGQDKVFPLERPVDTLRQRLLTSPSPVRLSLLDALDVAAENSREFQRQKETLYLAALNLTRSEHDFSLRFDLTGSAAVGGTADDAVDVQLGDGLAAAANSTAGTTLVASFVNTFLRSVIHGGAFDGSSILNLTLTQPLLRGAGRRIAREPLTQAERDVVYAMRAFEHFRSTFVVGVVSAYYDVVRQIADLKNVEANYQSLVQSSLQIEELGKAGRRTITDLGRARQSEYSGDAQRVVTRNRLQTSLDRFRLTLGLPVTAPVELDPAELDRLTAQGVVPLQLDEQQLIALAQERRYDHRTTIDEVEDAGRRVLVSEDALDMVLDFTAALNVPAEAGKGLNLDWSKVNWSAGFQLDLALDKLVERNAYRAALISLDAAIRTREQSGDQIAADVRAEIRNIQTDYDSYRIQLAAVPLAAQRVEATTDLYDAGRAQAIDKLDAQNSLLQAQLSLSQAVVDYAVARLSLMRDLEALVLEPKGLRFDPALPMPQPRVAEQQP